jgi:hypothetical protein
MRLMPDFIIIGGQRCGTTSLYNYLTKHPCVVPAHMKEIHFFDINFCKGVAWYRAEFPSILHEHYAKQMGKRDLVTGEASPYYIFHPLAAERVSETIPQVKLIALLRNPVDRAYSHYYLEVRRGRETLSFEDAIDKGAERLAGEKEKLIEDENYYSLNHRHYSYLARGIYVDQLKPWMSYFPREQILILRSEDLYDDPPATLERVTEFLDLPIWEPKRYEKYHRARYPKMSVATRERLVDYYEPHNQRLLEYLGMDFGWNRG